jgi:hypothetical protein
MAVVGGSVNRLTGRPRLPVFGLAGVVTSAWSATDKGADQVLSNSNRTVTQTVNADQLIRGTQSRTTGPYKFEVTFDAIRLTNPYVGLCSATSTGRDDPTVQSGLFVVANGDVWRDGVSLGINIGSITSGQVLSIDIDATGNTAGLQKTGGSRVTVSGLGATKFPCAQTVGGGTCAATINTGQSAFTIATTGSPPAWG